MTDDNDSDEVELIFSPRFIAKYEGKASGWSTGEGAFKVEVFPSESGIQLRFWRGDPTLYGAITEIRIPLEMGQQVIAKLVEALEWWDDPTDETDAQREALDEEDRE